MKQRLYIIILLCVLASIAGCTGSDGGSANLTQGCDTLYTEAKAMSIHRTDPERALMIIDSAVNAGNIKPQRAQYLKALTQYGGFSNRVLARQMCLDLLESSNLNPQLSNLNSQPSTLKSDIDSVTVQQTYQLLASIEYTSGNFRSVVSYATEASRLAHALNMPTDVAVMEGHIAHAMAVFGRTDEGIERLHTVIDELRHNDSFKGARAFQTISKRLLHILIENDRLAEGIPVCEAMLERLDELENHPEQFSGIASGFDPAEYIDFSRGQTLAFLTIIYAHQYTLAKTPARGDLRSTAEVTPAARAMLLQKALEAENGVFRTKWSQSVDCDKMMIAAYHHLGQFERFDQAMDRIDSIQCDTISNNFYVGLEQRSIAAEMRGRYADALHYLRRAVFIHDSLDFYNQREQLAEQATVYHLQEEQFARQQAEADARFLRWVTAGIIIILVLAVAFAVYFFYQRRETMKKNRVLAREIAENLKRTSSPSRPSPDPSLLREGSIYSQESTTVGAGPVPARIPITSPSSQEVTTPLPQQGGVGGGADGSAGSSESALFETLRDTILREQLYLNPSLDRQMLVDRFGVSKERIGAAFAKGSPYKSLIDFLTDCRLHHAARLLTERPDLPIADVARESGFPSADTFGRNFKQKYTLTPSQYRESNGE